MPDSVSTRGAVGESAETCVLQVYNDGSDARRAVLRVTEPNLCRSHAAYAFLLVDGDLRYDRVDLNNSRTHIEAEVRPGERAVLLVHLVDLHNGVTCIRLGDIAFELESVAA